MLGHTGFASKLRADNFSLPVIIIFNQRRQLYLCIWEGLA